MDFQKVKEAADFIIGKIHIKPRIAVVLGSGFKNFAEKIKDPIVIPYSEIPHFPVCSADGHKGELLFGKIEEKYVLVLNGRVHYYEGFSMEMTAYYVWVLRELEVQTLILTNAAGAMNDSYGIGDLVAIVDHIKLCPDSPLRGITEDKYGTCFNDMSKVYDAGLLEHLKEIAYGMGMPMEDGVYAYMGGPQYETPAEIRALSVMGADLVGMSTVPEVIVAHHTGMKVLAVSCVTNYAAGINEGESISHEEVKRMGESVSEKFQSLMEGLIGRIKTE